MAIFDWKLQTIQRSAGRSAVEAAAYRSGMCLHDRRIGREHDYTRRRGIHAEIVMPPGVQPPKLDNPRSRSELRARLWNAAEAAEPRKNSVVARELIIALPHELPQPRQILLARAYAGIVGQRLGVAVDLAVHPPARGGDGRNWHAHILFTTRRVGPDLTFGGKTRELDVAMTGGPIIAELRERWAALATSALADFGSSASIDHRSLAARGVARAPDRHIGPRAMNFARKLRARAGRLSAEAAAIEREALADLWPRASIGAVVPDQVRHAAAWEGYAVEAEREAREAVIRAKAAKDAETEPKRTLRPPQPIQPPSPFLDVVVIEEGFMEPVLSRTKPVPDVEVERPGPALPAAPAAQARPEPSHGRGKPVASPRRVRPVARNGRSREAGGWER